MKPFRPKFTDATLFVQIYVYNDDLIWLENTLKSKIIVNNSQIIN
jgi:hypothetical protein